MGAAVTAKVTWLPNGSASEENGDINSNSRPGSRRGGHPSDNGQRTRYISCTPLLGSDDKVGVWMVVMVENELVTGSLASRTAAFSRYGEPQIPPTPSEYQRESTSTESGDNTNGVQQTKFERSHSGHIRDQRKGKVGSEGGRLYADFMRNATVSKPSTEKADGRDDIMNHDSGMNGMVNGELRVEEIRTP